MWFQGNLYQNRLHPQFFLLFWNKIADAACISLILAFNKIALLSKFSYRDETIIKPPWIFQLQLIQWTFFSLAEQGGRGSACGHRMGWHRLRSAVPSSPPPAARGPASVPVTRGGCRPLSPAPSHPGTAHADESRGCGDPVLIPAAPACEWCPFWFTKPTMVHSPSRRRVPASDLWTGQLAAISSWWVKTRNMICSDKP